MTTAGVSSTSEAEEGQHDQDDEQDCSGDEDAQSRTHGLQALLIDYLVNPWVEILLLAALLDRVRLTKGIFFSLLCHFVRTLQTRRRLTKSDGVGQIILRLPFISLFSLNSLFSFLQF